MIIGAKVRWEGLRAQYRRYLSKLKTKSGQAASKITKWRYHDQMQYLEKFLNTERPRISSVAEIDITNNIDTDTDDIDIEDPPVPINIQRNPTSRKRRYENARSDDGVASSTLMKYLLEKKMQEESAHPIEQFFSLMARTAKTFPEEDQRAVRNRVFTIINEFEEKQERARLCATRRPTTSIPFESPQHRSPPEIPQQQILYNNRYGQDGNTSSPHTTFGHYEYSPPYNNTKNTYGIEDQENNL